MSLIPSSCFSWASIVQYIDNAYMDYLNDESKVDRKNITDHRVHACLYFINPIHRGYVHDCMR